MDLADVALFTSIVAAGSLSKAGRQFGISPMAASRRLAALETELGVRLIHRTTRSIALTSDGETFLPLAQAMLNAKDAAVAAFSERQDQLTGTLRITAPNLIGRALVVSQVVNLMAANPALRIDLTLSDSIVDIVASGIDVAIRVAPLQASELIAIKLADNPRILCAAPSYLRRNDRPIRLADLDRHDCLTLHTADAWLFVQGSRMIAKPVSGPLSASSVDAVRAACRAGAGLAMLTYWDVVQDLARGELESVSVSDAEPLPLAIWAILPNRQQVPRRVRVFIDEMKRALTTPGMSA